MFLRSLRSSRAAALRYLDAVKVEMFNPDGDEPLTPQNIGERTEAWKFIKRYFYDPIKLQSDPQVGQTINEEKEDYG